MNPLAKPLDYVIKLDKWSGSLGRISELGYDAPRPPVGEAIAYCNLFDQRDSYDKENNTGEYGPYLDPTDTSEKYDEGVIDPKGAGWEKNLREQFQLRKEQGYRYVELDNPDAYKLVHVMQATALAETYGLGVIAKNPGAMEEDATAWVAHPNVFGVIIEKDAGSPTEMDVVRRMAGKPDLPCWFVSFGNGMAWAQRMAVDAVRYKNMSVTHSSAGEYGSSEDILKPFPSVFEPGAAIPNLGNNMAWRLAKSLETLRDQVNAKWPGRDKSSDGTIGDAAHASTNSDHNPNSANVVTAMDITDDPAHGLVARSLAEALVASRDPRIKYIISNAQIISSLQSPWVWRPYNGSNAHRQHVHISVMGVPTLYDDVRPWALNGAAAQLTQAIVGLQSGKGSWYSQYSGKYLWVDDADEPGSAALTGTPDDAQGISFYDRSTLGQWFEVHAPNGRILILQHTDIGPNPRTGRTIDIAAVAAEMFGYTPRNFPTDSIFRWRPAPVPIAVVGLSPVQQAIRYRDLRGVEIIPPPTGNPMPDTPTPFNAQVEDFLNEIRPVAERYMRGVSAGDPLTEYLLSRGWVPPAKVALPKPTATDPGTPPAPSILPGLAGGLTISSIIGALMGTGTIGTPFGTGAEPTTTGTLAGIAGLLAPFLGMGGAGNALLNAGSGLLGLLGFERKK